MASQVPGGELIDFVRAKRLLVAIGVVTIAVSALIFRLWPSFPLVSLAEVLQGMKILFSLGQKESEALAKLHPAAGGGVALHPRDPFASATAGPTRTKDCCH